MTEAIIIIILLLIGLFYTETISTQRFFNTEDGYFLSLKEKDYDFLLKAKYGEKVDCNKIFMSRMRNALYASLALLAMMTIAGSLSFLNFVLVKLCLILLKLVNSFKPWLNVLPFLRSFFSQLSLSMF